MGRVADEQRARFGHLLQPRGEVGRVADRGVVHSQVVADRADHHEAGVEPHPDRHVPQHVDRRGRAVTKTALDA